MKKFLLFIVVLLLFLGAGAYWYYQKHGEPQAPDFKEIKNLKITEVVPFPKPVITFEADAVLNNSNPFGLDLVDANFDVYVDKKKATKVAQRLSTTMPAESDFTVPLIFEVPLANTDIVKDLSTILTGGWKKKSVKIRAVGEIHVKAAAIEIPIPFDYEETVRFKDLIQ